MNQRQRARRQRRRRAHEAASRELPTLRQETFSKVKRGHIVPAVYQRNFAVEQQVAVHFRGKEGCKIRNVRTAGTRGPFYRRTSRDGSPVDDIEASLSALESASQPALVALRDGQPLTLERKGTLAQFFGIQAVRGPAFFDQRADVLTELVSQLRAEHFKPGAVDRARGDITLVRERVLEGELSATQRFRRMLGLGMKLAAVLGSMRWHLLAFGTPLLAYSDHPVVMWPKEVRATEPFTTPRFGPLDAVEVRVPLSSQLAVLMTWGDFPDKGTPVPADSRFAGELNAFVIGQSEKEWMHRPGDEPPIAGGPFGPLAPRVEFGYTLEGLEGSRRRASAAAFLHRVRNKDLLRNIEIADVNWQET